MTNLYFNYLQERLRSVARLIFPSDPVRCVNLSNTNKYTRLYLRGIIQRAKDAPFNLTITNKQLARLSRTPYKKFLQWFCHDIHLPKVFRRVRWFIREIIRVNISEDLGAWDILSNRYIPERPINWPTRKTMAHWQQLVRPLQEERRRQGPVIESLGEAEELIRWMQGAYSPSCSFESDSESVGRGEEPDDDRFVDDISSETAGSRGLNGPPVVSSPDQLLEPFKNILINSDNDSSDDKMSSSGVYDQLNRRLCIENGSLEAQGTVHQCDS